MLTLSKIYTIRSLSISNILIKTIIIFSLFVRIHAFAEDISHHHHLAHVLMDKTPAKPVKKFIADQSLKKRMDIILKTMTALNKKEYLAEIGEKIEFTVQDIFKNCKLAPDADAAIHPILAEILEGASQLKRGQGKEGHKKIHNALLKYEDYFDHAGWKHD